MPDENSSALEKLAIITRYFIVAVFGVALASGFWSDRACAIAPVSAAPNYLSFTVRDSINSHFYVTDTNRKIVCVYMLNNDRLRLVSVRTFDHDLKIVDGNIPAPIGIEKGITADQAEQYVKNCRPILEAAAKKYGQLDLGGN